MNITKILSHLGLIENTDYIIENDVISMLPKTRMVEQLIEHEAVAEQLDAEGNVIVAAQEAYTETVMVEESYTPEAPSQEQLDRAELELRVADLGDVMELVGEYLKDHVANEDESINPEAFSIANINDPASSFWRMSIAKPSLEQLEALRADLDPRKVLMAESAAALKFLAESDYKAIRHIGQKALGIATSMSEAEYLALEQERQAAREKVVK
jgi:hypothetical protein